MRVLRDFKCSNDHITERFIDNSVEEIPCDVCGNIATRMLGYGTIVLSGLDQNGLPGAWHKWADVREKRHRQTIEKNRKDGKI